MPPRRRSQSGYRGVRRRPNGRYTAEIRSGDTRVPLGTFFSAQAAARAYDVAAWRLGRDPASMNFRDSRNLQEAVDRAPQPFIVTAEDRRAQRLRATLDLVAENDRRAVDAWYRANPEQRDEELAHWETLRAERGERRAEMHEWRKERRALRAAAEAELAAGRACWPAGDPMWNALQDSVSDTTNSGSDFYSSDSDF